MQHHRNDKITLAFQKKALDLLKTKKIRIFAA